MKVSFSALMTRSTPRNRYRARAAKPYETCASKGACQASQIGIVALKCPPGQGEHHEEEYFRRTAGYTPESQAGDDECKGQKAGRKSLKVTPLQDMARAWNQD